MHLACLNVYYIQEWELFIGLKLNSRNNASRISLPKWIDESRSNYLNEINVILVLIALSILIFNNTYIR